MQKIIARLKRYPLKFWMPFIILGMAAIIFTLLLLTRPESPRPKIKERIWRVKTLKANPTTLAAILILYGKVETPDMLKAAAPKKSRVAKVLVHEGDRVKQGELMLVLDPRDFEPRLTQAIARAEELRALIKSEQIQYRTDREAIKHDQAIVKLEKAAVKRAQLLKNKKLGSKAALEEAEESLNRQYLTYIARRKAIEDHQSRLQQLQARLDFAEADVALARLDLERSRITAPFDGIVESVAVTAGDPVKDNQILLNFYPLKKLEVRAKIPAHFQAEIELALLGGKSLNAVSQFHHTTLKLQLNRLSGKADARGIDGLFSIQSETPIRLGTSLTLKLYRPPQANSLAIPRTALYDNNRIYRVGPQQRLQAVTVQVIGDADNDQLIIASPEIKTGDLIVTTLLANAVSGMKVEVQTCEGNTECRP